jgi:hypothetical protein
MEVLKSYTRVVRLLNLIAIPLGVNIIKLFGI